MKSVTLIGSSSGRNAGDAALMSSIMDAVDEACGEPLRYEIPTIKPGFVRNNYRTRVQPIGILPWNLSVKMLGLPTYRSVMRTDLTLIFDAILFDRSLYNPLFNFLSTLYLLLPMARKRGKKMAFYNVGAGPVTTPAGRKMLRVLAEMMDFITVRDRASFDILKDIGVENPRLAVAGDAAVNTVPAAPERAREIIRHAGLDPEQDILALNVNPYLDTWSGETTTPLTRDAFLDTYTAAVNRVREKIDVQVAVVATQHLDVPLSRQVAERLRGNKPVAVISNVENSHYEMKAVLGQASLLFAMRLHSMILGSSALAPIAGLAYQPKVHHYFEVLGIPEHSLGFGSFSEQAVHDHLLRAWEKRAEIKAVVERRLPELQAEAKKSAELVACLRRGEDLDAAYGRLFG